MSDTAIAASSLVADAQPYIVAIVGVVISAASAAIVALVKKYTGIAVSQDMLAKVDSYINDLAAKEIAAASDNLATAQINVGSPIVSSLASKVVAALPAELNTLGITPTAVASKLTAEFGRLQASMTAVPVAPAVPAASTVPLT